MNKFTLSVQSKESLSHEHMYFLLISMLIERKWYGYGRVRYAGPCNSRYILHPSQSLLIQLQLFCNVKKHMFQLQLLLFSSFLTDAKVHLTCVRKATLPKMWSKATISFRGDWIKHFFPSLKPVKYNLNLQRFKAAPPPGICLYLNPCLKVRKPLLYCRVQHSPGIKTACIKKIQTSNTKKRRQV